MILPKECSTLKSHSLKVANVLMTRTQYRKVKSSIQRHPHSAKKVFPLLCPVREKDWVPGWQYRMIYSRSGLIEPGCIFATPHHGDQETIWYVTLHDPFQYQVGFVRLTPTETVVSIGIQLIETSDQSCESHITYEYTALHEASAQSLREHLDRDFAEQMAVWESCLNIFLAQTSESE